MHPPDFPLVRLDRGEATVVEALVEYLDHDWIVMPDIRIADRPPVQIDIVIAHPAFGVAVIEVKSYVPEIRGGQWVDPYGDSDPKSGGPPAQLTRNRYALRDHVRARIPEAAQIKIEVEGAVAFPVARGFRGDAEPGDLAPNQMIWSSELYAIDSAVEALFPRARPGHLRYDSGLFPEVIRTIRPDVEFDADPDSYSRWAQAHMDRVTGNRVRALEPLDANRRVYVSGGAGTGKSRLAVSWAIRAVQRGERTLLVCFNEPLGAELRRRTSHMEDLTVGAYYRVAQELDGMPPLEIPDDADTDFWNNVANGHLHLHWPEIAERFDTIVIDEAQDFSPAWMAQLEALLDPEGPRRLLLVGDPDQDIHSRGFTPPRTEDGWTRCELTRNARNSMGIARLIRNRLNGPLIPAGAPETSHIRYRELLDPSDPVELVAAVQREREQLLDDGHNPSSIAVVCLDSTARGVILTQDGYSGFDDIEDGHIVCDSARRLKGLEFPTVILVSTRREVDERLLLIGVSRAVLGLTVIGPAELGTRLHLANAT